MLVLVFDPFHGAAGDMIIGALLDCGADKKSVLKAMQSVIAEPGITEVSRAGIRAVKVATHATPNPRTLSEVMQRLCEAEDDVPKEALAMAKRIFKRINDAEERVHGSHTHFHEVGADDAIADVIGACTALYSLRLDGVAVMPIALGSGSVNGSHGTFPVPAPATTEILRQSKLLIREGKEEGELCTPTGAALLAEFSTISPSELGTYSVKGVGYGAGTKNPAKTPNVIRAMIVETIGTTGPMTMDTVDILETNVDDVSGEVIANAITRFLDAGARDASAIPIIMKKGRPGFLIRVICSSEKSSELAEHMARELGTLGVRCFPAIHRFIADRTIEPVTVEISGNTRVIPVKYGRIRGEVYTLKAEFDQARIWAEELGIPVHMVLRAVEKAGWKSAGKKDLIGGTNED
ncbi:MAG TPA: nickel pincer cofactor biosynthesis protein LarC [Methanoregula sp.]|nr:nickel pincer cofactor biosynthesis protein LarC [Methanoregula sp.]